MQKSKVYFGSTPLNLDQGTTHLDTVEINQETFFKIENVNQMNPFFMTIVSDVDHWMFISSTGGLTCGRVNAESALFPYYTDDKIHDSAETTGSNSIILVSKDEQSFLWKPFSLHHHNVYSITRNLYKNTLGNKVMFEEINHDLMVAFRYTYKNSAKYGFIKESEIINLSDKTVSVDVCDGLRNILPYGVTTQLQTTLSTLLDGYKRCELIEEVGLGIYNLSSILTDKAEPSESLKCTTVFSLGLSSPTYLLSEQQLHAFSIGDGVVTEHDVKGRRGSYYVCDTLTLAPSKTQSWMMVAELNQSAVDVQSLIHDLSTHPEALKASILENIEQGNVNLTKLVYEADGLQCTANAKTSFRHFSNTLFNIMRGGVYADGYQVESEDFISFVKVWNQPIYAQFKEELSTLPVQLTYQDLVSKTAELGNKDVERLVLEYLPLTFSRRHGDPSRPWNRFSIEIAKEDGSKKLNFEGNWRDIFQNWEALSLSYPEFIESIIAKFVNASTVDGYNPYRITKNGLDWEELNPDEPWSNIGYWGDHQIIYLLKLMELSKAYHPKKLLDFLHKEVFVYADVPYRIKGFAQLMADPHNSILYDYALDKKVHERVKSIGSDGKLVMKGDERYTVNLIEKLLVMVCAKLSNYVPEGGIWMNTQRPEWNDANNALVGYGLSMVTLYYIHRFQVFMTSLLEDMDLETYEVSSEVAQMLHDLTTIFKQHQSLVGHTISDEQRFEMVKALGEVGETYRNQVYTQGFSGKKVSVSKQAIEAFTHITLLHLKDSIHKNKREDNLYHSYNLIKFNGSRCEVSHLYEMLEGQVSVLSSKALSGQESLDVLDALKHSAIYREDQDSYMLYPNRALPRFLDKNIVPEDVVMTSSILKEELAKGSTQFILKDVNGHYHFNGSFRNGNDIAKALRTSTSYQEEDILVVKEIFSTLFNHHAFTGRSGTFYKYEGLGSIYWHMVSKLVLATQETYYDVLTHGRSDATMALHQAYKATQAGLGIDKSPAVYGAFPTDAYSHTPSFSGVQQPGLTGQVKEDFISRLGELGVKVHGGLVSFNPLLLDRSEFLQTKTTWKLPNSRQEIHLELEPHSLGFTFCTVPIIYTLAEQPHITVVYHDQSVSEYPYTHTLDEATSQSLFKRDGRIEKILVSVDKHNLR